MAQTPEHTTPKLAYDLFPKRPDDGHKGTFGHVFIIGGSRGYSGAPVLAGMGAIRSGAGLVTVGLPESLGEMSDKGLAEAMTFPLAETAQGTVSMAALEEIYGFTSDKDAVVIGPGLSQHAKTGECVREVIQECSHPLLIDADGLNALKGHTDIIRNRKHPTILTPHPGEMSRLLETPTSEIQKARTEIAIQASEGWQCTVVLKGKDTVIASPNQICMINPTGNAGMATGGSGDVLSGLLGGLLAQGMTPHDASVLGVFLHGLAGDLAAHHLSQSGMTATDIARHIPYAWLELEHNE
jgi:NAD(P)H-hydrate epimerase